MEDLLRALSDYLLRCGFPIPICAFLRWRPDPGRLARGPSSRLLDRRNVRRRIRAAARADGERRQARRTDREAHRAHGAGRLHLRSTESEPHADRPASRGKLAKASKSSSRSPTRASTSSASRRCATCSARSGSRASAVTTRATWRPASKPRGARSATNLATR